MIDPGDTTRMLAIDHLCDQLEARGATRFRCKVWLGFILIVRGFK